MNPGRWPRLVLSLLLSCLATVSWLSADTVTWINDGSQSPPRLSVEQAIRAMGRLPRGGQEWSREEKVARIAEADFDGFMVFLPPKAEDQLAYRDLAARHGLAVTLQCAPTTLDDLRVALVAAGRMTARGLVAMIRPTFVTFEEGAQKIRAMMAACREAGMPFYVETHRGTITQDLMLSARWAREIPGIQIHADLSHFVISYEIGGAPSKPIRGAFDAILGRTGMIHGRIGNGEQVQIDIGLEGKSPHAQRFAAWWKQAMFHWLRYAKPGDVFVFKSELGPPGYSIVDLEGREISDRWAQALVVRDLGIAAWNDAVREFGAGLPYSREAKPRAPFDLTPQPSRIRVIRGVSHQVGDDFYLAGQPAQPHFDVAKELGVKTVLNLRLDRELHGLGFEEDVTLEFLEIDYVRIPVDPKTIDDTIMEKLLEVVDEAEKPILIHDSNANRVWGLWAVHLAVKFGVDFDATKAQAAEIGVTNLVIEEFARDYLKRKNQLAEYKVMSEQPGKTRRSGLRGSVVLLGLLLAIVLLVGHTWILPPGWEVRRSVMIRATPERVHACLTEFPSWPEWSVWNRDRDPSLEWSYHGPQGGPGAAMSWRGKRSGAGTLRVTHSDPDVGLDYDLVLQDGKFKPRGSIRLERTTRGETHVVWTDSGEYGGHLVHRFLHGRLEERVGDDLESSLLGLKRWLEAQAIVESQ